MKLSQNRDIAILKSWTQTIQKEFVIGRSAPVENPGRVFVNFLVGGSMVLQK